MADKSDKTEQNVSGKYYVDRQCIDCGLCQDTSPEVFGRSDDGVAFVKHQPANEAETASCVEAMEACPVQAIGDNGE